VSPPRKKAARDDEAVSQPEPESDLATDDEPEEPEYSSDEDEDALSSPN
jgi:hypothetical protein